LTPKDERFLQMEPWEIELEFHTYDEYEKAASGQSEFQRVEEYATEESEFKQEIAKFTGGSFDHEKWEEVK
jgi:hypothetical protein